MNKKLPEGYNWTPLPDYLDIKPSHIHGVGIWTFRYLEKGHRVTHTHTHRKIGECGLDRTVLGGLLNHAGDQANCKLVQEGDLFWLETIQDIPAGSELTLSYGTAYCGSVHLCDKEEE